MPEIDSAIFEEMPAYRYENNTTAEECATNRKIERYLNFRNELKNKMRT
jgi:hypothetical protein